MRANPTYDGGATERDPTHVLNGLLRAANQFSVAGFQALGPSCESLLPTARYVVVSLQPLRAKLIAEIGDEQNVVYQREGLEFPADLGQATAAFVEAGVRQLSPTAIGTLRRLLDTGARVAVIVERDLGMAHAVVDRAGSGDPVRLFSLQAPPDRTH